MSSQEDLDDEAATRRRNTLVADVADQTEFPRSLVSKLLDMWDSSAPPHFVHLRDGALPVEGLRLLVKDLGVTDALILDSVVRVIMADTDGAGLDFAQFMRGYAWIQAPSLETALPFVFRVYDLDGDGALSRAEFERVLSATIKLGGADATKIGALVAAQFAEHDADDLTYEHFAYFVRLNTQSVYAACAFMPKVQHYSASAISLLGRATPAPLGGAHAAEPDTAADGLADVSGVPFFDESFLASLESLKSTAAERAERWKGRGNESFKKGKAHWDLALAQYTSGLHERAAEPALNASLYSNRAAIHLSLKNNRYALADSLEALALEPRNAKAARRAALSAQALGEIDEARRACTLALELHQPSTAGGPAAADLAELEALSARIDAAVRARGEAQAAARAAELVEEALARAIAQRGVTHAPFLDEALQAQLVGPHSGARVWWDAEADELHWPVMLLYPQYQQTDFLHDVVESTRVADILAEVLPADGPRAPWDARGEYAEGAVSVYVAPGREGDVPRPVLSADATLAELMAAPGTITAGIPMLLVLIRGSAFEREWRKREELD
jgi:Ca2+-binding EF-hand superfamily protein